MKDKKKLLLDNFFSGQLSDNEKQEFTDLAGKDKEFVKSLVRDIELHSIVDELYINKEDSNENVKKGYFNNSFKKYFIYISSAAAILCLAMFFFLFEILLKQNRRKSLNRITVHTPLM